MSRVIKKVNKLFQKNGVLSKAIMGFQPRVEQTKMAEKIAEVIENQEKLVVEAGTGTGKTFAYLAATLISNKKTVVSTGSKNLQDQLFNRDLPTIAQALKFQGKIALLKGRGNYLCLERFDKVIEYGVLGDKSVLAQLNIVRRWQNATKTGDLTECSALAEDSPIIPQLISTTENCLGSDCPFYDDCYVVIARRKALEADLLVINHHLFFADITLSIRGFGELIPHAEAVIFDEAHLLPDIAGQYFGHSLTSRQLYDWCQDMTALSLTTLKDMGQLKEIAQLFSKTVADFRLSLGEENEKGDWRDKASLQNVQDQLALCLERLNFAQDVLDIAKGRTPEVAQLKNRATEFINFFTSLQGEAKTGACYWYETLQRHFRINVTPLNVADLFAMELEKRKAAWVFTSATLEVGGTFQYFIRRLGLNDAHFQWLKSPFDYPKQAMLCVPRNLPETHQRQTVTELANLLLPMIVANKGRCFLLCTSYFMMRELAHYLREHSDLNVLLQGESAKSALLTQFIEQTKSVLVATASFWEGVDVRGDALSLVIIDKLPFASPNDPLFHARLEDCRAQKKDPFSEIQVPEAVITLKQGVGRLIRDVADKGAIVICDPRLVMRSYGAVFLQSLPNATRTRDTQKVIDFLISNQRKSQQ